MVNKYIVRYIVGDDPRSQEAILLAENKDKAKQQLVSDLVDIVDYVKVLDVTNKTEANTYAESFFNF